MKKKRGITLIALIITIIVLLILAGVSVSMVVGENGIVGRAQKSSEKTKEASKEEQKQMTIAEAMMNFEKTEYIDKNGDKAIIPAGFAVSQIDGENIIDDGLVVIDSKGNEFVWIPCTEDGSDGTIKYDRYAFRRENWRHSQTKENEYNNDAKCYRILNDGDTTYYCEEIQDDEVLSITLYGGFYIGRFETGIESENERTEADKNDTSTKPIVQANKNPYNWLTRDEAKEVAENIDYNYNGIVSKLCSSYSWDTALKFIETKNSSYVTNSVGGNYKKNGDETGKITKTGFDTTHPCNIYDMGGNLSEWVTESFGSLGVLRGGRCIDVPDNFPAASRWPLVVGSARETDGFRITLFIQ